VPDAAIAGPRVFRDYAAAYGPATIDNFAAWLTRPTRRQLREWLDGAGPELTEVEVDGEPAFVRAEDVDDLATAKPSSSVRLLGGFDVWVLGPGTADSHVIPPGRRAAVSKTAGWIAPLVVVGGVVGGTLELDRDVVKIAWFSELTMPPRARIEAEVERVAAIVGRPLSAQVASR
jgi:hypothetical protein